METKKIVFRAAPRRRKKRLVLLTVLVLLLTVCAAVSTIAWLTARDQTNNQFTVGQAGAEVREDFPDPYAAKSNVRVGNTGNIPVYVRAAVTFRWQTADGKTLAQAPEEGSDYEITWGSSSSWFRQGDIFCYALPLQPETETDVLIESCKQSAGTGDGWKLVVDVSVQTIQAEPADAVQQAWGVTVGQDGTLQAGGTP